MAVVEKRRDGANMPSMPRLQRFQNDSRPHDPLVRSSNEKPHAVTCTPKKQTSRQVYAKRDQDSRERRSITERTDSDHHSTLCWRAWVHWTSGAQNNNVRLPCSTLQRASQRPWKNSQTARRKAATHAAKRRTENVRQDNETAEIILSRSYAKTQTVT